LRGPDGTSSRDSRQAGRLRTRHEPRAPRPSSRLRKEAEIPRGVISRPVAVARAAGKHSAWLVVTARASGSAWRGECDARRTREGAVVAPTTRVRVVRVEHGGPAVTAQKRPVKRRAPRVDDPRPMHRALKRGAATLHPRRERGRVGSVQKAGVGRSPGAPREWAPRRSPGARRARRTARRTRSLPERSSSSTRSGRAPAVAARAVGIEDRGDVDVKYGRQRRKCAVGRACTAQHARSDDRPGHRTVRVTHSGRIGRLTGALPVRAKTES
jgi:hypothetical protein